MNNVKNFVDEKSTIKIIEALCALDFFAITKLSNDSGVPVSRLRDIIDRVEKISQLDKGRLIVHLVNIIEIEEEKQAENNEERDYTTLKEFQQRKTG